MYQANIRDRKNKQGKHTNKNELYTVPDDEQEFGLVTKMLGNGRVQVLCADGGSRIGRIRGNMRYSRHRVVVENGDLILVSGRDFEDKLDVVHKYSHDEMKQFVKRTMLPEKILAAITGPANAADGEKEDEYVTYDDDVSAI